MTRVVVSIACLFVLVTSSVAADFDTLFTSNMVLQRNKPIRVFGTGEPNEEITITFVNQTVSTVVNKDKIWNVSLAPQKASKQNYELKLTSNKSKKSKILRDILVGDVWVCAGQSNMGWAVHQTLPQPTAYPAAQYLRLLRAKTPNGSKTPQTKFQINPDFNSSWQHANEQYASKFSAVSYYFGLKVNHNLDVPIGLIEVALGGTDIASWMPIPVLEELNCYNSVMAHYTKEITWAENHAKNPKVIETYKQKHPSDLYNGMMHPLTRLSIKGMIWYQGENNAPRYNNYEELFTEAIKGWRTAWAQDEFPFIFVQLPAFGGKNDWQKQRTALWPYQREAQAKAQNLNNVSMAVTLDLGEYSDIHPKYKYMVGKRLALHAIALEKQNIIANGPIVKSIHKDKKSTTLKFYNCPTGLIAKQLIFKDIPTSNNKKTTEVKIEFGYLMGFEVADSDGKFYPAEANITAPDQVTLTSDKVSKIIDIRYGFAPFPICNLFNTEGLPAQPFRTDAYNLPPLQ
ncbi:hypothetical protein JD969_03550 [Planctomycetota bacterium]|nr:hypothetical protein JD969_03550 [Planctomycetota bacterium]